MRMLCGTATGDKRHGSEHQSNERDDDDHERDRRHDMGHFKLHRVDLLVLIS